MKININLFQDWMNLLKNELEEVGYDMSNIENEKIPIIYYSLKISLIEMKPREIKVSKEFHYPKNLEKGWGVLKNNIESGRNLNIHLGRGIKKLENQDGLLNSWGVYHFHLGEDLKDDGFIERTGPLVFAMVRYDTVYVIGIYNHGDWYKQEIVQIIHDNWPEVIKEYQIYGMKGDDYTEKEIKALRRVSANIYTKVNDGTVYFPIGGGYSSSGFNTGASNFSIRTNRILNKLEEDIKSDLKHKIGGYEIDAKLYRVNDRYVVKFSSKDPSCCIVIDDLDIHQRITGI